MSDTTQKKNRIPTQFTPKGVAVFPRLNTPDTKFKDTGRYSLKLRLPEAEARSFLAEYDALSGENFAEVLERTKGKVDKKTGKAITPENTGLPFELEMDKETQTPTGNILIPFSCNAQFVDKKTQQVREIKPGIYDSKGTAIDVQVWGGSVLKVAFVPFGYYNDATMKAGISFRLQAVQVIKLVRGGGEVQFGVEEGGYVAEPENQFTKDHGTEGGPDVSTASKGNF